MKKILFVLASSLLVSSAAAEVANFLPEYPGRRYAAQVPDTYDLAERCGLACEGMTGVANPDFNYYQYFNTVLGREPACLMANDGPMCTDKFIEALPGNRVASGNMVNRRCEKAWIDQVIQEKRPTGRMLGAAGQYYLLTHAARFLEAGRHIVDYVQSAVKDDGDRAYFTMAQKSPGADHYSDPNISYHTMVWWVDGLVKFYRASDYQPALDLAGKFVATLLSEGSYFYHGHEDGSFSLDPIMWYGVTDKKHFHINTLMRLSCLEYALEVGDKKIIDWVRQGYEFGKRHGEPVTGWFPEAISATDNVNAVYNICEMCCVGDMVGIGIKLALAGYDDCWDDVDSWLRNVMAEGQLTSVDWLDDYFKSDYCRAATAYDRENLWQGQTYQEYLLSRRSDMSFDHAAQRSVGGFGGWVAMNDWFGAYNITAGDMAGLGIMQCCTGNAVRSLYSAFYNMLAFDDTSNELKLNLLMNRASKWADIDSHIPYQGRIDINIKQSLKLSVRIPGWVDKTEVQVTVDEDPVRIDYDRRVARIGHVNKGQTVKITFPIKVVKKPVRVRYYEEGFNIQQAYVLTLKGNTVVDIKPEGQFNPLYQRDYYLSDKTRYKKVERFICDVDIPW